MYFIRLQAYTVNKCRHVLYIFVIKFLLYIINAATADPKRWMMMLAMARRDDDECSKRSEFGPRHYVGGWIPFRIQ